MITRMGRREAASVLVAAVLWQTGCSLFRPGPGETVRRFYTSVAKGKADEALGYVHPAARSRLGDNKIRMAMLAMQEEIGKHGGLTQVQISEEKIQGEQAQVESRLSMKDGKVQTTRDKLVRLEGRWYLDISK